MRVNLAFLFFVLSLPTFSQNNGETRDFLDSIKQFDASVLWTVKKVEFTYEGFPEERTIPEPLGFIGENFQRFYIRFTSVIQDPSNHFKYLVYGKTRVKSNICEFQGTITIKSCQNSSYSNAGVYGPYKSAGQIQGTYEFYEDAKQTGAGILKGEFTSKFLIDPQGNLKYNTLGAISDGFNNNQFRGHWTSYSTGTSKKCNWGDRRIPDSGDLDVGAGEFNPNEKYHAFGWESYNPSIKSMEWWK